MSIPGRPQLSLQPPAGRGRGAVRIATWAAGEGRRPGGGGLGPHRRRTWFVPSYPHSVFDSWAQTPKEVRVCSPPPHPIKKAAIC